MRSGQPARPNGNLVHRTASVAAESFTGAEDSLEVVWTTGASVERWNPFEGMYIESLEVTPKAVRMARLQAGVAVLDTHDQYELAATVGSVVPGTARLQNGEGTARVRLADTPDVADIVAKIRAGHIRSLSVGYIVHTYERLAGGSGELDELRAVDWEPVEISFVTVPADPGCQIRSGSTDMTRIVDGGRRRARSTEAPDNIQNRAGLDGGAARSTPTADAASEAGQREPRERGAITSGRPSHARLATVSLIRNLCGRGEKLSRAFERELLEDQLVRVINAELTAGFVPVDARAAERPDERHVGNGGGSGHAGMAAAMQDALFARMSGAQPSEAARPFMGASMVDLARGLMEQRGERVRWESPSRIMARFGAHTTSDFPNLLQAATSRYLLSLYNASPSPLKALTGAPRRVPDFRAINALSMLPVGVLRAVPENAEFKRIAINEGLNGYKLATFGEIFALSRQAFINDDLGYFANMVRMWARAATETEATQLAGLITGTGPLMGDGVRLYDVSRGNVAASGGAITVTTVSSARVAMRGQKNVDGSPANVVPKYLVVGPAKETEAEQFLANVTAATPAGVNPFSGKLELVVDPRLLGNSWRLFADPTFWPVIEYAQLIGQEGLFTDERLGFDIDGIEFKARLDFGCGTVDWRGSYLNPGD
jgi:phage head maturation protease